MNIHWPWKRKKEIWGSLFAETACSCGERFTFSQRTEGQYQQTCPNCGNLWVLIVGEMTTLNGYMGSGSTLNIEKDIKWPS